jgi:hypothetical protein
MVSTHACVGLYSTSVIRRLFHAIFAETEYVHKKAKNQKFIKNNKKAEIIFLKV